MQSGNSLYGQLVQVLVEQIKSGAYKVGEAIPSERKLCAVYDISRSTVRKAIEELEKRGYLERRYGSGTYVSRPAINTQLSSFYSFSSEMKRLGYSLKSKVIRFSVIACPEELAEHVGVLKGEEIYEIRRLRIVGDEPLAAETSYIPVCFCPALSADIVEEAGLYNALNRLSDIVIDSARETFEAVLPDEDVRRLLSAKHPLPVLKIVRAAYALDRQIEYCVGFVRGDRYKYSIILK